MSTVRGKGTGRPKVAILTFQRALNYGAVLQAFALQRVVSDLGFGCDLLDLDRPPRAGVHVRGVSTAWRGRGDPSCALSSWAGRWILRKIYGTSDRALGLWLRPRFRTFEKRHITFSRDRYRTFDELKCAKLEYSAYVTGSDQVWNPGFPWDPEPYFLTFAPSGAIRIAYAASFGVNEVNPLYRTRYATWLQGFRAISVREDVGVGIVENLAARRATVVLDPTLLIDADIWGELCAAPTEKGSYLFCYNLANDRATDAAARRLGRQLGLRVVRVGSSICRPQVGVVQRLGVGPLQFVSLIQHASLVVTNSFHGSAFAINLGRPFFSVITSDSPISDRNSRLESLLRMMHLGERAYEPGRDYTTAECFGLSYGQAHYYLRRMRLVSLRFLKESLNMKDAEEGKPGV